MFNAPQVATYGLILLNVLVYAACVVSSGHGTFDSRFLLSVGAITNDTLVRHEYWRLIAAAFLHFNVVHIFLNMVCLVSWGAGLESRVGAARFLVIYLVAAVAGNITSILGHQTLFVAAGASGAISGVLGALLSLTLLGRTGISAQFFVVNLAANAALMSGSTQVDWMGHLGGFVAGMAVSAILAAVASTNLQG